MHIFSQASGVSKAPFTDKGSDTFISISVSGGSSIGSLLLARAPATGIQIQQAVDMDLNRSFGGSWLIGVFGHRPLTLSLQGLDIYRDCSGMSSGAHSIQAFYNKWNVYARPSVRLYVGLGGGAAYYAVMNALNRTATANNTPGIASYTLGMVGVRI